jgi:hypothetical protein
MGFCVFKVFCVDGYLKSNILRRKLRGRSPQANYTDRATAPCRRS